jgi:hypothetical protein
VTARMQIQRLALLMQKSEPVLINYPRCFLNLRVLTKTPVYPQKSNKDLANTTVEQLMNEPSVKGTTTMIEKPRPESFYRALQHFVDSKEKATTGESKKKKEKGQKRQMEFWSLIKVVRIYTKADALSTGAVIVDIPGVHDANAARAAVAAGYMKQCTGKLLPASGWLTDNSSQVYGS